MAGVKVWLSAMRLRTLPLALSTVWMGNAVIWQKVEEPYPVFLLSLLTTISLQILSNFANDYGDYKNGADNHNRQGPQRAVQSGAITAGGMMKAIGLMIVLSLCSGIALIYTALWIPGLYAAFWTMLCIGVSGIAAAYFYTAGKKPYGYIGLGDVAVFFFFGWVGVGGNAFLQTHQFTFNLIWPAIAIGALSCGVLNLNNMRDQVNDKATGKRTLVVRYGFGFAKVYHSILLFSAWFGLLATVHCFHFRPIAWAIVLPILWQIVRWIKTMRTTEPLQLDHELKPLALSTAMIALILFLVA